MEVFRAAVALMVRSMVLSAGSAGQQRLARLQRAVAAGDAAGELARIRDENRRLMAGNRLLRTRFDHASTRKRYVPMQRLQILWHMAFYGIPRDRVTEHFLIARSTFCRWLHAAEKGDLGEREPTGGSPRKTPVELARLIWDIFEANPHFGRHRIANTLWLLGVFVSASTARNVLLRPKPRTAPAVAKVKPAPAPPRRIVARSPNHVWNVDRTRVLRWGIWPTSVFVAIDHYSRAVVAAVPLEGPNAGWVVEALEQAFLQHGAPRHLITDQDAVFTSAAFAELLSRWEAKHRLGAVGKHGSIAVTERVILALKQEWLRRVPVLRGLQHLSRLLSEFMLCYNECRGHTTLGGALPAVVHRGEHWTRPPESAKTLPAGIERRVFSDVRVTAYRLAA